MIPRLQYRECTGYSTVRTLYMYSTQRRASVNVDDVNYMIVQQYSTNCTYCTVRMIKSGTVLSKLY